MTLHRCVSTASCVLKSRHTVGSAGALFGGSVQNNMHHNTKSVWLGNKSTPVLMNIPNLHFRTISVWPTNPEPACDVQDMMHEGSVSSALPVHFISASFSPITGTPTFHYHSKQEYDAGHVNSRFRPDTPNAASFQIEHFLIKLILFWFLGAIFGHACGASGTRVSVGSFTAACDTQPLVCLHSALCNVPKPTRQQVCRGMHSCKQEYYWNAHFQ